jgi:exonuclease III
MDVLVDKGGALVKSISDSSILDDYLTHASKSERVKARKQLLELSDSLLLKLISQRYFESDREIQVKLLRFLGRKGGSNIHRFLMAVITAKGTPEAFFEQRLAAIEALSYQSSPQTLLFLKRILKSAQAHGFDEATVYTLVESISHSERPDAPTAFETAKFIPRRFKLKKSYDQFSKKIQSKIDELQVKMRLRNSAVKQLSNRHIDKSCDIKVLTLNLGLLHNTFAKVPFYHERSAQLAASFNKFLSANSAHEIICLQELWYLNDFATIKKVASQAGYHCAISNYELSKNNGLQILIKSSLIKEVTTPGHFEPFRDENGKQARALFEKGGQIQRGLLSISFTTKNDLKLFIATTHLSPLPRFFGVRNRQVSCLNKILRQEKKRHHFAILGADLNIASNYEGIDGSPEIYWDLDRFNYLSLVKRVKAQDSYAICGDLANGYTNNQKMAGERYTNRNVKQRLDYIITIACKKRSKILHLNSQLEFTEPIDDNKLYISDHFGVSSLITLIRTKILI